MLVAEEFSSQQLTINSECLRDNLENALLSLCYYKPCFSNLAVNNWCGLLKLLQFVHTSEVKQYQQIF